MLGASERAITMGDASSFPVAPAVDSGVAGWLGAFRKPLRPANAMLQSPLASTVPGE